MGKAPESPVQAVSCFSFVNSFALQRCVPFWRTTPAGFLQESTMVGLAVVSGLSKERGGHLLGGHTCAVGRPAGPRESTWGSAVPHVWENQES